MTIDVREKFRVVLEQILMELGTTKPGDTAAWRAARFDELKTLGDSMAKIIDSLEAMETEEDTGPYEYISQGIT